MNWKMLQAVKHSKRYQWKACSKEIERLNNKLLVYEGSGDLIDPKELKKKKQEVRKKTKHHQHSKTAYIKKKHVVHKKKRSISASFDRGYDSGYFDYDDVTNIGKEASHIAEEVVHMEEGVEDVQHKAQENYEKAKETEEDREKVEESGEKKEEEVVEEKKGDGKEDEKIEVGREEESKEVGKKVEEQVAIGDASIRELTAAPETKVYRPRSKKAVMRGTRALSTRIRTRSQLIRTPFTEEKKKEVNKEIWIVSPQKEEERKKIKYYCKPDECSWDFLKDRKIMKKEEALLKLLNEGIPDVSDFSIRLVDSEGTFVHNFRLSDHVLANLKSDESRWVLNFCTQKFHQ